MADTPAIASASVQEQPALDPSELFHQVLNGTVPADLLQSSSEGASAPQVSVPAAGQIAQVPSQQASPAGGQIQESKVITLNLGRKTVELPEDTGAAIQERIRALEQERSALNRQLDQERLARQMAMVHPAQQPPAVNSPQQPQLSVTREDLNREAARIQDLLKEGRHEDALEASLAYQRKQEQHLLEITGYMNEKVKAIDTQFQQRQEQDARRQIAEFVSNEQEAVRQVLIERGLPENQMREAYRLVNVQRQHWLSQGHAAQHVFGQEWSVTALERAIEQLFPNQAAEPPQEQVQSGAGANGAGRVSTGTSPVRSPQTVVPSTAGAAGGFRASLVDRGTTQPAAPQVVHRGPRPGSLDSAIYGR